MLGSKLRTWMENHIVRSRRKRNKNDNEAVNNKSPVPVLNNRQRSSSSAQSGDSALSLSSPARRREVSPIQNNASSRAGWVSPKSDGALYQNYGSKKSTKQIRSNTYIPSNGTGLLNVTDTDIGCSANNFNKSELKEFATNKTIPECRQYSNMNGKSNYAGVVLEKQSSSIDNDKTSATKSTTNNIVSSIVNSKYNFNKKSSHLPELQQENEFSEKKILNANNMEVKVESATESLAQNQASTMVENNHCIRSNNETKPTSYDINVYQSNYFIRNENDYGKILKQNPLITSPSPVLKYKSLLIQNRFNNPELLNSLNHGVNNNLSVEQQYPISRAINASPNKTRYFTSGHDCQTKLCDRTNDTSKCPSYNNGGNYSNSNGCNHLSTETHHHQSVGHVINSLSSPESAYSTGYSTDGASPGPPINTSTNTTPCNPEYYINMRTGTHYYPNGYGSVCKPPMQNKNKLLHPCDMDIKNYNVAPMHTNSDKKITHFPYENGLSPDVQRRLQVQNYKGLESPSPRQRCRIKTNPWIYTNNEDRPNSSLFNGSDDRLVTIGSDGKFSVIQYRDTDSSSQSSIHNKTTVNTILENKREIKYISEHDSSQSELDQYKINFTSPNITPTRSPSKTIIKNYSTYNKLKNDHNDIEDSPTYGTVRKNENSKNVSEKETAILSDATSDCESEIDTGLDGGDEFDTDDLLGEQSKRNSYKIKRCTYIQDNITSEASINGCQLTQVRKGRRKKRIKSRNKQKNYDVNTQISHDIYYPSNSSSMNRPSRSVGGTPMSQRKNLSQNNLKETITLGSRSNSLSVTDFDSTCMRSLAIAESERALLQADEEANIKYKQLISEAESLLLSFKATPLIRDPMKLKNTTRITCNIPTNKRVEMLRNCDIDLKRDNSRMVATSESNTIYSANELNNVSKINCGRNESNYSAVINKRIEVLRMEESGQIMNNSKKILSGRISPSKTHLTNFISQNGSSTEFMRLNNNSPIVIRKCMPTNILDENSERLVKKHDNLYLKDGPFEGKNSVEFDTDCISEKKPSKIVYQNWEVKQIKSTNIDSEVTRNITRDSIFNQSTRYKDHNYKTDEISSHNQQSFDCPQSEPVKRKIYPQKLEQFHKYNYYPVKDKSPENLTLQKNVLLLTEDEKNKQMLNTSPLTSSKFYHGRKDTKNLLSESKDNGTINDRGEYSSVIPGNKRQLILSTIQDLKDSLEYQCVELDDINYSNIMQQ